MITILQHTRKSDILFHSNGVIYVKSRLSKLLSLQEGDIIGLLYNDADRTYYVYRKYKGQDVCGNHEGQCRLIRKGKRVSHYFRLNSVALCKFILTNLDTDVASLPVGDPVMIEPYGMCVPIITKLT